MLSASRYLREGYTSHLTHRCHERRFLSNNRSAAARVILLFGMIALLCRASFGQNQNPAVSISSPTNGSQFVAPASVSILANASDPDGSVKKVEFFQNGNKIGEDAYPSGGWTWNAWTGDADSGISSNNMYTVAVNMKGSAVTINGVSFQAHALSGSNFAIGGGDYTYNNDANNVTGNSRTLANDFMWNGNPRTVTLYNLVPGTQYKTTFFSVGWEAPGGRIQTFDAGGDSMMLDQDLYGNNNGICISYTFVADGSGTKTFTITPSTISTFHLYALANCVVPSGGCSRYRYVWNGVPLGNYSLTARATDNSGGSSLSSGVGIKVLRAPDNPDATEPGMNYNYYEGSWSALPDFNKLTPVKIGAGATINVSVRNKDEHFGLVFSGYVEVPSDGIYTFYTTSDDGSRLYIGDTLVVNNNDQSGQERYGTIGLSAGRHAIKVTYFQGTGGCSLSASWSGPGIAKQEIPATALSHAAKDNVAMLAPTGVYSQLSAEIERYHQDVEARFPVNLQVIQGTWTTPEQVRAAIKGLYQTNAIKGVILVGNMPMHKFNMHDFDNPNPLYYEDFDLPFLDSDSNGIDDHYSGPPNLKVWVANMRGVVGPDDPGIDRLRTFFNKTHAYYVGDIAVENRGLAITGSDWPGGNSWFTNVAGDQMFGSGNTDMLGGTANPAREDYFNAFKQHTYALYRIQVHSSESFQEFDGGVGVVWAYEIAKVPTLALFSVNHGCSIANWGKNYANGTDPNTGMAHVFGAGIGQALVGQVRVGMVFGDDVIYARIKAGDYVGKAYFAAKSADELSFFNLYPTGNCIAGYLFIGNPFLYIGGQSAQAQPPSVSVSTPTNGAILAALTPVTVTANASDSNGSVVKVEFFLDGVKIGEDADPAGGWTCTLNSIPAGDHSLTARATDNDGETTLSSGIGISVGRAPENPTGTVPGIRYYYYTGAWPSLPNFGALVPVKMGIVAMPDISVRNSDTNFGFVFTGYVEAPSDGIYTFYTTSDDGSRLYIGDTMVVDNDGSHGAQERSGSIRLGAGKHAIKMTYYQGGGPFSFSASWSGPGTAKQVISASALSTMPISTPSGYTDFDSDGMPDDWETQFGLNPFSAADASADPDGDGMSNLQEYLADTDPTNGLSCLRMSALACSNGQIRLEWCGGTNATRYLEYTSSLPAAGNGSWTVLLKETPPTLKTNSMIVSPTLKAGFFRIRATRP